MKTKKLTRAETWNERRIEALAWVNRAEGALREARKALLNLGPRKQARQARGGGK